MRTNLIRIGNSRGVRLPKTLIDPCRLGPTVDSEAEEGRFVLRLVEQPRLGWDDAFRRMAERGDDAPLDGDQLGSTEWDEAEWEW